MTVITIQEDGEVFRLTAAGHATGSPTVCASVSALVYALGGYLKNLERAGEVTLETFFLGSGCAELEARGEAARAPFEMAGLGLLQLEQGYGTFVRVKTRSGHPVCPVPCPT